MISIYGSPVFGLSVRLKRLCLVLLTMHCLRSVKPSICLVPACLGGLLSPTGGPWHTCLVAGLLARSFALVVSSYHLPLPYTHMQSALSNAVTKEERTIHASPPSCCRRRCRYCCCCCCYTSTKEPPRACSRLRSARTTTSTDLKPQIIQVILTFPKPQALHPLAHIK